VKQKKFMQEVYCRFRQSN